VKPFARLRIQKQRAYERPCDHTHDVGSSVDGMGSRQYNNNVDWDEEEDSDEEKRKEEKTC
jgi:hypothetical protein